MILIWFTVAKIWGEFKHEVRQFQKPYDNQQAEQISGIGSINHLFAPHPKYLT